MTAHKEKVQKPEEKALIEKVLSAPDTPNVVNFPKNYPLTTYDDGGTFAGLTDNQARTSGTDNIKGIYTYKNGDVYEGTWKADKRHGKGKMTYKRDGDFYDGEWKDGQRHGEGVFRFLAKEQEYRGPFKNGKFHGKGTYMWEDSDKDTKQTYEGNFKEGKKDDQNALFTFTNEDTANGVWENDKFKHWI